MRTAGGVVSRFTMYVLISRLSNKIFSEIADILSGCCLISVGICVVLRCMARKNGATNDAETAPLISGKQESFKKVFILIIVMCVN